MKFGLFAVTLLILVSLTGSCSAEREHTRGDAMVNLEITEIEPAPPLDPFQPITVHYTISNSTSDALSIPDLNRLELEIRHESGIPGHSRTLPLPLSLASIQQRARAKVPPPKPHPVDVGPDAVRNGTFPTLDAWPPLPGGQVTAILRLPLAPGETLESQPRQLQVKSISPATEQELVLGEAALTNVSIRQKLITITQPGSTRVLLLSTVYPDFLSVVVDCSLPRPTPSIKLLHHWPPHRIQLMLAEVTRDDVVVFTAKREGHSPADALTPRDRLPLREGFGVLGLVHVERNEDNLPIDDYLLITGRTRNAATDVVAEYWMRNTDDSTWSRAEVGRYALEAGKTKPELRLQDDGFTLHIDSDSPACALPLATKLTEYRRLASDDAHPIKIQSEHR